jgi:hypothetical protein
LDITDKNFETWREILAEGGRLFFRDPAKASRDEVARATATLIKETCEVHRRTQAEANVEAVYAKRPAVIGLAQRETGPYGDAQLIKGKDAERIRAWAQRPEHDGSMASPREAVPELIETSLEKLETSEVSEVVTVTSESDGMDQDNLVDDTVFGECERAKELPHLFDTPQQALNGDPDE